MQSIPDLREIPDLPEEIKDAALEGNFILFVGAGVSMLLGFPSWKTLAQNILGELRIHRFINYQDLEQLKYLSPKTQLSIASLIAKENSYQIDLRNHLIPTASKNRIYEYLNNIGCTCVTTNYDENLCPVYCMESNGSTSQAMINRINSPNDFYSAHLNTPGTVIHLHGSISTPSTIIMTTKEYLSHYDNENVQSFLGELFEKKVILFIGYGLEENEILEHILRRGNVSNTKIRKRFSLQGFFSGENHLYYRLHEYYQRSFGVHILGFLKDHEGHNQLETICKLWSEQIDVKAGALSDDLQFLNEVTEDAQTHS